MEALQKYRSTPRLLESRIVLIGLVLAIVGLIFRDAVGFTSLLAAVGVGLIVAGTVYLAVEGPELLRLSVAFISLVVLPLFAYGSSVRWIGAVLIGTVSVGVLYTRRSGFTSK